MQIIFIRHGDPDYVNDTLTEKGRREAELLANRVAKWKNIDAFYVSPMGRAQATAKPSLDRLGRTATTLNWMREVVGRVTLPGETEKHIPWDFMPAYWTKQPEMYHREDWVNSEIIKTGETAREWEYIKSSLDCLLRDYGYRREGNFYKVEESNDKTIVLVCHMGFTMFSLGHLLNISPMLMMHGFDIPPTGVTVLSSEERTPGEAYFRVHMFGDTRHLYEGGEPMSQSGYFGKLFQEV